MADSEDEEVPPQRDVKVFCTFSFITWTHDMDEFQIGSYDETPFMKLSTTPGKSKIVRVKFLSTWSLKGHNFHS